jgi:hypothetical protein
MVNARARKREQAPFEDGGMEYWNNGRMDEKW